MVADFSKKEQESNQTVIRYQLMEKQMRQIIEEEKNLNKKAVQIVQLREKAADAKKYVQDTFQKIDQNLGEKFLPTEKKTKKCNSSDGGEFDKNFRRLACL